MPVKVKCKMSGEQLKLFKTRETYGNPWILKSAIQKAYRRNNPILFDWCFDDLWELDPKWLVWRAVIFPAEENWQLGWHVGRVVKEIRDQKWMNHEKTFAYAETALKQVLVDCMTKAKNKDGDGLRTIGELVAGNPYDRYEPVKAMIPAEAVWMLDLMVGVEDFASTARFVKNETWGVLWDRVEAYAHGKWEEVGRTQEDYQRLRDLVGAFYFRGKEGGMVGDRTMLVANAMLAIQDFSKNAYGWFTDLPVSKVRNYGDTLGGGPYDHVEEMPWFGADMHTQTGKKAVGWFCKKNDQYPKGLINDLWFIEESALINERHESQYWWDLSVKLTYDMKYGLSVAQAKEIWTQDVGPDLKEKVEYLVKVGA